MGSLGPPALLSPLALEGSVQQALILHRKGHGDAQLPVRLHAALDGLISVGVSRPAAPGHLQQPANTSHGPARGAAAHVCLTPLDTSQFSIRLARLAASSEPSSSKPKPPLMTSPLQGEAGSKHTAKAGNSWNSSCCRSAAAHQPTPPPLCRATHVAPLKASPTKLWTAMSARRQHSDATWMF